jgi:tRNA (Thr-GGU) A37 N-methylase
MSWVCLLELLNHCHNSLVVPYVGARKQYRKHRGVFKTARPARPQPLGRAEHTKEYVSTSKGRERIAKSIPKGATLIFNTPLFLIVAFRPGV